MQTFFGLTKLHRIRVYLVNPMFNNAFFLNIFSNDMKGLRQFCIARVINTKYCGIGGIPCISLLNRFA